MSTSTQNPIFNPSFSQPLSVSKEAPQSLSEHQLPGQLSSHINAPLESAVIARETQEEEPQQGQPLSHNPTRSPKSLLKDAQSFFWHNSRLSLRCGLSQQRKRSSCKHTKSGELYFKPCASPLHQRRSSTPTGAVQYLPSGGLQRDPDTHWGFYHAKDGLLYRQSNRERQQRPQLQTCQYSTERELLRRRFREDPPMQHMGRSGSQHEGTIRDMPVTHLQHSRREACPE